MASSTTDLQAFLRFLTQDAKIPLSQAMARLKGFQAAGLGSVESLAAAKLADLQRVVADDNDDEGCEKLAKQIHNAARRVRKRNARAGPAPSQDRTQNPQSQKGTEAALALPAASEDRDAIQSTVIVTNRAPLVLAFAVVLLQYTMPGQPLSSRLSLAQAQVSSNARSKALSLGIERKANAEDEGWGQGQPSITVMGRQIKVMRRGDHAEAESQQGPALWGLDLEALRASNDRSKVTGALPIHTAESARAYLLKSFDSPEDKTRKAKERNLGLLLGALHLLYKSWADTLDASELDKRAWAWYVKVRPEVENGPGGWGGRGSVRLQEILELCRNASGQS